MRRFALFTCLLSTQYVQKCSHQLLMWWHMYDPSVWEAMLHMQGCLRQGAWASTALEQDIMLSPASWGGFEFEVLQESNINRARKQVICKRKVHKNILKLDSCQRIPSRLQLCFCQYIGFARCLGLYTGAIFPPPMLWMMIIMSGIASWIVLSQIIFGYGMQDSLIMALVPFALPCTTRLGDFMIMHMFICRLILAIVQEAMHHTHNDRGFILVQPSLTLVCTMDYAGRPA